MSSPRPLIQYEDWPPGRPLDYDAIDPDTIPGDIWDAHVAQEEAQAAAHVAWLIEQGLWSATPARFHLPGKHDQRSHGRGGRLGGPDAVPAGRPSAADAYVNSARQAQVRQHHLIQASVWVDVTNPELDTPEKVVAKWDAQAAQAVNDSAIFLRMQPSTFRAMLKDGEAKNVFATGTTEAAMGPSSGYLNNRKIVERELFGIPSYAGADERPIYGYFDQPHQAFGQVNLGQYGRVAVELKGGVKDRSTVSFGDSMDTSGFHVNQTWQQPTPARNPTSDSVPSWTLSQMNPEGYKTSSQIINDFPSYSYTEAQIHGGVSVDDIAGVTFAPDYDPPDFVTNQLDDLGIPWSQGG